MKKSEENKNYAFLCGRQAAGFGKGLVLGVLVGAVVGVAGAVFSLLLTGANNIRAAHPQIVLGLPAAGLVIIFLYHVLKDADDRGTNMVLCSLRGSADIPFQMAPLIVISTVLTQLCGGSAGREGAALQLGGSIADRISRLLKLDESSRHTMVRCGMSAGFSALFGTPMAAAFFSLEAARVGIMQYAALAPAVAAAYTAYFIAQAMGCHAEAFPVAGTVALTPAVLLAVLLLAVVCAAVSVLFCAVLHAAEHAYKKYIPGPYLRIFVGGCLVVLLAALLRTDRYLGSGISVIEDIFEHGTVAWYVFLLKIAFTALTLGAGYKGGEIVPSFCIGAALGCLTAPVLGLPADLGAACGMVGVFCGVTNCPVTALLISFELFGFEGMPLYLVTAAVSYALSGRGGLYHAQELVYDKIREG